MMYQAVGLYPLSHAVELGTLRYSGFTNEGDKNYSC